MTVPPEIVVYMRNREFGQAIKSNNTGWLKALIRAHGADAVMFDNGTPLMLAASRNATNAIELLVASGANVNAHDKYGVTAIYYAVDGGHLAATRLLLKHGADVRSRDEVAPLICSARGRNTRICQALLNAGARILDFIGIPFFDRIIDSKIRAFFIDYIHKSVVLPYVLDVALAFASMRLPPYVLLEIIDWLSVPAGGRRVALVDVREIEKIRILVCVQRCQNRRDSGFWRITRPRKH